MDIVNQLIILTTGEAAPSGGLASLNQLISLIANGAKIGGTLWGAWGVIQFAQSFGENGPEMKQGIWKIVAGAMVIAVGVAIAGIKLNLGTGS